MRVDRRPAAFIDRDGVINADLGYVHQIDQFRILPGVVEGLRLLASRGYALVVVTNQAGIARGKYGTGDFEVLSEYMRSFFAHEGVLFAGIYHCPHHPKGSIPAYSVQCLCRKPAPGMLLEAARDLGLSLADSVMIGDKPSDAAAGRAAGVRATVLVRTGHALPKGVERLADHCCADLAEAASWICNNVAIPGRG